MKLKRLAINRLPGINQPFEIEAAGAGFHVVFGPNGVGKSSICRALESVYWEDRYPSPLTSVNAEFEMEGELWWGQRDGNRAAWRRENGTHGSPNLPPSHNRRCFFLRLRDLIDPSRDGTADIASEIRRQMSGGFDLDKIGSDLFSGVSRQAGRRQRRDFNNASDEVQKAVVQQTDLQRRADELETLKEQLEQADAAARRLVLVERAIGLARRRQELAGIVERIDALPEALATLTGKEVEEVERYQHQADTLAERTRSLEQQLHKAREARQQAALDEPVEPSSLAAWRENADELSRIELELDTSRTERNATRRKLAAALHEVGDHDAHLVDQTTLTLAEHGELFAFLRSSQEHTVQVHTLRERLRQLDRLELPEEAERDLERLRAGAEALRGWLRAPEPEDVASRVRGRWRWLLFAGVMILLGTVTSFLGGGLPGGSMWVPIAGLLGGLGIGATLALLLLGDRQHVDVDRQAAQAAFEELGLDPPDEWDLPSVGSHLHRLERVTADMEAAIEQARDRSLQRRRLENELAGLSEPEAALDARRKEIGERLGLETIPPDAELVDFARALDHLRVARRDDEAAAGRVEGLEEKYAALLSSLADILEAHGESKPDDAATAKARIHHVADRSSRLEQALSDERSMTAQIEEIAVDREATVKSVRRIYADASLSEGDMKGLVALIHSLEPYRDLVNERTGLEGQIGLDQTELAKVGAEKLAEADALSLEQLKGDLSRAEARAGELRNEIAEITTRTDAARNGNGTQGLITVREETRAKLRDLRDDAVYARAGRFLIGAVEREFEHTRMPRVLERARDHFFAFTHHGYKLELGKDNGSPRLFAREARSSEMREIDELSDGTRVQLLLAARIAFAEEVEQNKTMPLFLDEALDQSDPRRFEAVVRSLGRVAREQDRQIFYLTSDPMDVDRIRDALGREECELAAGIDLGLIRTQTASAGGARALRVELGPPVPVPDGLSSEEYGAALDVPALRPELGYAEQHFFYLLWDAPDLLHDFLLNGIERAGQWRTVVDSPLAERLGSRSVSLADITARLDLLETFCELWMQGKNRPVDRAVLEESDALTERFLEDVTVIAQGLNGDPRRLVDALDNNDDPRLRGFRKSNIEKLRNHLTESGHLDDRPVLTEDKLRLDAQTTPAATSLPDGVANDCLRRWWAWAQRSSASS